MSSDPNNIICPHCGGEIALTEALTHGLREGMRNELLAEARREREAVKQEREAMALEKDAAIAKVRAEAEAAAKQRESEQRRALEDAARKLAAHEAAELEQRSKVNAMAEQIRQVDLTVEKAREEERHKAEEARREAQAAAQRQLAEERTRIEAKARAEAAEESTVRIRELEEQAALQKKKIGEAQQAEIAFRAEKAKLEDEREEMKLAIARQMDEERGRIKEQAEKRVREEIEIRLNQKDEQLASLNRTIEDLRRKAEQGSQQLQGEAQEAQFEEALRAAFPHDLVEPVGKGIKGADIRHEIRNRSGEACGVIVWECKQTKNWSPGWIDKVKSDQREAKGDIAVIVSTALPSDVATFDYRDGVWLTRFDTAVPLAAALRMGLEHAARAESAAKGRSEKEAILFNYITGNEFYHRVAALVEAMIALNQDLDAEVRAMNLIWKKRRKQIERANLAAGDLWGELGGITGTQRAIAGIELAAIAADPAPKAIDSLPFDGTAM